MQSAGRGAARDRRWSPRPRRCRRQRTRSRVTAPAPCLSPRTTATIDAPVCVRYLPSSIVAPATDDRSRELDPLDREAVDLVLHRADRLDDLAGPEQFARARGCQTTSDRASTSTRRDRPSRTRRSRDDPCGGRSHRPGHRLRSRSRGGRPHRGAWSRTPRPCPPVSHRIHSTTPRPGQELHRDDRLDDGTRPGGRCGARPLRDSTPTERSGRRPGASRAARRQHAIRARLRTVPVPGRDRCRAPNSSTSTGTGTSICAATTPPDCSATPPPTIRDAVVDSARRRLDARRDPRGGDRARGARLRAIPVDRAGALHELGHRGQPDGDRNGTPPHRPPLRRCVRPRLPRRRPRVRPGSRRPAPPAQRAAPLPSRTASTTSTGSTHCSTTRPRLRPGRGRPGFRRMSTGERRVPPRAPIALRRHTASSSSSTR